MMISTAGIEGLHYFRKRPSSLAPAIHNNPRICMYDFVEVFYEDTFLDFIFEARFQTGPNGEKYITAIRRYELDEGRLPVDVPEENWNWYSTIEEASKFIFEREFSSHL